MIIPWLLNHLGTVLLCVFAIAVTCLCLLFNYARESGWF